MLVGDVEDVFGFYCEVVDWIFEFVGCIGEEVVEVVVD